MSAPRPQDTTHGRRQSSRLRLVLEGRLITHRGSYPVRIDNLSREGAHLSRARQDDFTRCVLQWLGHEAMGQAVWMKDGYCGVLFDKPLAEAVILATRGQFPDVPEALKLPTPSRVRRV